MQQMRHRETGCAGKKGWRPRREDPHLYKLPSEVTICGFCHYLLLRREPSGVVMLKGRFYTNGDWRWSP